MILKIIIAIMMIESAGVSTVTGDHDGMSYGSLQIRPVMIRDVNRIVGYEKFQHNDAFDMQKAREIASIYLVHYKEKTERKTGRKLLPYEVALLWNGGPDAIKQYRMGSEKLQKYREKFERMYNR